MEEKLKHIYSIVLDVWRFCKANAEVRKDDTSYWENVKAEGEALLEKYKGSEFCMDMVQAVYAELERE